MTDPSPDESVFDRSRLADVVEAAPDGVVVDRSGIVRYWNGGRRVRT